MREGLYNTGDYPDNPAPPVLNGRLGVLDSPFSFSLLCSSPRCNMPLDVSISNYGNYSSDNYGSSRLVSVGEIDLYFSYETVVAFRAPGYGLVVRQNDWGTTTGKHLNQIDRGNKKARLSGEEFEAKLKEMLAKYSLVKS